MKHFFKIAITAAFTLAFAFIPADKKPTTMVTLQNC